MADEVLTFRINVEGEDKLNSALNDTRQKLEGVSRAQESTTRTAQRLRDSQEQLADKTNATRSALRGINDTIGQLSPELDALTRGLAKAVGGFRDLGMAGSIMGGVLGGAAVAFTGLASAAHLGAQALAQMKSDADRLVPSLENAIGAANRAIEMQRLLRRLQTGTASLAETQGALTRERGMQDVLRRAVAGRATDADMEVLAPYVGVGRDVGAIEAGIGTMYNRVAGAFGLEQIRSLRGGISDVDTLRRLQRMLAASEARSAGYQRQQEQLSFAEEVDQNVAAGRGYAFGANEGAPGGRRRSGGGGGGRVDTAQRERDYISALSAKRAESERLMFEDRLGGEGDLGDFLRGRASEYGADAAGKRDAEGGKGQRGSFGGEDSARRLEQLQELYTQVSSTGVAAIRALTEGDAKARAERLKGMGVEEGWKGAAALAEAIGAAIFNPAAAGAKFTEAAMHFAIAAALGGAGAAMSATGGRGRSGGGQSGPRRPERTGSMGSTGDRPSTVVINWNAPTITAGTHADLGREVARAMRQSELRYGAA